MGIFSSLASAAVPQLLVTAPRKAATTALSQAITKAVVPAAISGLVPTPSFSAPKLPPQIAQQPAPTPPTVQEAEVVAQPQTAPSIPAVAPALASGAISGLVPTPSLQLSSQAETPQSSQLTVTAPPSQPAAAPDLANIAPKVLDDLVVNGAAPEQPQQQDNKALEYSLMAAGLLPAAAAAFGGGGGAAAEAAPEASQDSNWLKDHWKELATGGALVAGLAQQSGGAGGGSASEGLKNLADTSAANINRLSQVANAGMSGDIGGRGVNAIARMVRQSQAAIRQRYAAMGMSGSTAEADDLNAAAQKGTDLQFEVGQKMAQTGLAAIAGLTGQSAQIYAQLLNASTAKNTALGNALANFAAAVAT